MATKYDFEWVKNPDFARRIAVGEYTVRNTTPDTICYGTIVCHALFHFYMKEQKNSELTEKICRQLVTSVKGRVSFVKEDFLELYIFDEDRGYFLVDLSKGSFPLVFYPDSHSSLNGEPNPTRAAALYKIISILEKNITPIIEEFSKHTEWNRTLEENLKKRYFDPSIAENKEP